jgi:hypothetical protein
VTVTEIQVVDHFASAEFITGRENRGSSNCATTSRSGWDVYGHRLLKNDLADLSQPPVGVRRRCSTPSWSRKTPQEMLAHLGRQPGSIIAASASYQAFVSKRMRMVWFGRKMHEIGAAAHGFAHPPLT